jgi:hypothetical protein
VFRRYVAIGVANMMSFDKNCVQPDEHTHCPTITVRRLQVYLTAWTCKTIVQAKGPHKGMKYRQRKALLLKDL